MELQTESQPNGREAVPAAVPGAAQPGIVSALGMVIAYFLLQIVVGLIVGILFAIIEGLAQGADSVREIIHSSAFTAGVTAIAIPIAAILALVMVRRFWPAMWGIADPPGFGVVAPASKWFFLWAVLLAIAGLFAGGALTSLATHGQPVQQDIKQLVTQVPRGLSVVLALVTVCVAPVVEEMLFRGVLLSGLMRYMSGVWAVVISAVLFGAAHYPDFGFAWYPLPALVLTGLLLGWIRLWSRSLWPAITLHATSNLVVVLAWLLMSRAHR